jgi:hypothetical protein
LVTDSLSRRHSKSRVAEQPFVRMAAGQAKFLNGFRLKKIKRLEGDRITANKMRDVNKVDALFAEEKPIIFPPETSPETTSLETDCLPVEGCGYEDEEAGFHPICRGIRSSIRVPFSGQLQPVNTVLILSNRSPWALLLSPSCLLTIPGCYLNSFVISKESLIKARLCSKFT